MGIGEKLSTARDLLEDAQQSSEGERMWLLVLAWAQLQEIADVLESTMDSDPRRVSGPAFQGHTSTRLMLT